MTPGVMICDGCIDLFYLILFLFCSLSTCECERVLEIYLWIFKTVSLMEMNDFLLKSIVHQKKNNNKEFAYYLFTIRSSMVSLCFLL